MNPELAALIYPVDFPYQYETWDRPLTPIQICLHHTASPPGVGGDIDWWKHDGQPVSTPVVVGRDGRIAQIYPSERWAFSLGLNHSQYRKVEAVTIGIEIDTWGWLSQHNGKFYSYTGVEVPAADVFDLGKPWRGVQFFHKYTTEQIKSVALLLHHFCEKYNIKRGYKGDELWNISRNAQYALTGGIYGHASFRADKTDIHPQPDMIEMLKGLDN